MSFAARPIGLVKSGFVFDDAITSDVTNYNLRARAVAAGWDQVEPLIATTTVSSGIVLSADSTSAYAFDTGVTFPAGSSLTLNMQGAYVIGMGGSGAAFGGLPGGPALRAQHALTVNATGGVIGGGGGGGAGVYSDGSYFSGGGGRTGRTNSAGTNQGTFTSGGSTSYASGGTTGPGANAPGPYMSGGGGGGWGAAGGRGYIYGSGPSGPGGAGGAAVVGNANITWVNTGTRYGSIT